MTEPRANPEREPDGGDFIREMIARDRKAGKHEGRVATRFPPEPNGYLHIGHAKSIVLNFTVARQFGGTCNLRFDDTNPTGESMEYVESIERDVRWLGFEPDRVLFASDYFEKLYQHAEELVAAGKAYVDSSSEAEIRELRGTISEPGTPSRHRDRSVEENLDLFRRMRAGEFPDGAHVLRAKVDLSSPNMKMRDPLLYRIRHADHYRTGKEWCLYPLYDFTHCLSDAFECITHSLCTLEFENNRELYDWVLDNTSEPCRPEQTEFARLNLNYTVMSKRKLLILVRDGHVSGWDDPRMPTLSGLRRRGVTPESIVAFCERVGVAKNNSIVDLALLEHTLRDDLNQRAPRVACVLDPLEVEITTYPAGQSETIEAPDFPPDVGKPGTHSLPFSRRVYIDRADFSLEPPKGWHRLAPGREVRLRHSYVIECTEVVRDEQGRVQKLVCKHDPATRDAEPEGRKVKGTIQWVSAEHALPAEVRLYDRLFRVPLPDREEGEFTEYLNPESLVTLHDARVEPSLAGASPGDRFQFERIGFFCVDPDSKPGALVFNRTVALRDSWSKAEKKPQPKPSPRPDKAPAPAAPTRELTEAARNLQQQLGISAEEARVLGADAELYALFESAQSHHANPKGLARLLVNELRGLVKDASLSTLPFGAGELAELLKLVDEATISSATAKSVLEQMVAQGGSPRKIVEERGAQQIGSEAALAPIIDEVLANNPEPLERYRAGNHNLLGLFVGQVMRATGGKANPKLVNALLKKKLG